MRTLMDPDTTLCPHATWPQAVATAATNRGVDQATEPGERLVAGRYALWSLLGYGGMGRVWLAEDLLLNRLVALKELVLDDPGSPECLRAARMRALDEARAAARVRHDGVVQVHDVVKQDGRPWIVMELLPGPTLAEVIKADGPLPVEQVTRLGLRLLEALQATHRAGIVHGDVKPGNVHLCPDGRVVLADFGIARSADDDADLPSRMLAGSPAYAAPERLRDDPPESASDLFSLGATLFTAVEGRSPFDKGDLFATLTAVAVAAPGPFLRAGSLRPVIEGLLAKEPGRRLTAEQAGTALRAVQRWSSSLPRPSGGRARLPLAGTREGGWPRSWTPRMLSA
jgi:serine/threonine protein kinase